MDKVPTPSPHADNAIAEQENAQLRQLLRELVAIEPKTTAFKDDTFDQVSYAVKQAIQLGKQQQFVDQLTMYIHKKDDDIEKLCNTSYQEFVGSIDQLLKIRAGTSNMIKDIQSLREKMQQSTKKVIEEKEQVVTQRKILLNVEIALEIIDTCHFVLDIFNKVNSQIENNKYYSALKLIQEIKDWHIDSISTYKLADELRDAFPKCQEKIKTSVMSNLKEWLSGIKETSKGIGKMALRNVSVKQEHVAAKNAYNAQRNTSVNTDIFLEIAMAEENDYELDDLMKNVDLKPLFHCILIYDFLGEKEFLKADYEAVRKHHFELLLDSLVHIQSTNLKALEDFVQEVLGYFIVESTVISSTDSFRSHGLVDVQWDTVMEKMDTIVSTALKSSTDTRVFLGIKNLVVSFMQSIEKYGFSITKMADSMATLFDTFTELMKAECTVKIIQVIEDDEYKPLTVNTAEEYQDMLQYFKFSDEKKMASTRYPKTLSCTRGFVNCCELIQKFIKDFYKFAEGFKQQNKEIDELLKKSVDNLFSQAVNNGLVRRFATSTVFELVQIIINMEYFNSACLEIEQILSENKNSHKGATVILQSREIFNMSIKIGEKSVITLVNETIASLLTTSTFNWSNLNVNTETTESFALKIDEFLKTQVSAVISQLSLDFRIQLYTSAINQVALTSLELLTGTQVRRISNQAVESYERGILYLERCMRDQCPDIITPESYIELLQMMDYVKADLYDDFLLPNIKAMKYALLKTNSVIIVLEKLKIDIGIFSSAKDKTKRKNIETVIKGLRGV